MNPDHPAKTLLDAKQYLYRGFAEQFDVAVAARHEAEITRYFKLFPLIGCQTEGLDKYSRFVCGIVRGKSQDAMGHVGECVYCPFALLRRDTKRRAVFDTDCECFAVSNPIFYVTLLTALFENVAVIIDKHSPLVQTHYGPGKMLRVIQRLQEECDLQSGHILEGFMEDRQITRKLAEIQSLPMPSARPTSTSMQRTGSSSFGKPASSSVSSLLESSPLTDPRELAVNLEEMAMISQQAYMYHRFMDIRAKDEMGVLPPGEEDAQVPEGKLRALYNENGLLRVSGLARRVREAMKIDEYDETAGPTSSCVDDVFYILKRSVHRAMRAADPDCLAAMINATTRALENDYLGVFQRRMMTTFAGHEGRGGALGAGEAKVHADYIQKLTFEVQQDVAHDSLAPLSDEDKEKAIAALAPLSNSAAKFKQLLQTGIEQLFGQTLKPRLRPLFHDSYKDVKYVLDGDEYAEADANDVFAKRFRAGFDGMVEGYKVRFLGREGYKNAYGQQFLQDHGIGEFAITSFIVQVSIRCEPILTPSDYLFPIRTTTQLGALRFDRDLRSLSHYLANMTEWPSRDRFTRLNQMVTLLSFEAVSFRFEDCGFLGRLRLLVDVPGRDLRLLGKQGRPGDVAADGHGGEEGAGVKANIYVCEQVLISQSENQSQNTVQKTNSKPHTLPPFPSISMPNYIIEHMEDALHEWCLLEYKHMLLTVGGANLHFTSLTPAALAALPPDLLGAHYHASDVLGMPGVEAADVCLLDPAATEELKPEDGDAFGWFLFGGILGDDPPRDRTGELRRLGFATRHLGPVQMTTDTAVTVTKRVVEDKGAPPHRDPVHRPPGDQVHASRVRHHAVPIRGHHNRHDGRRREGARGAEAADAAGHVRAAEEG
ncbi:COG4 transport protein-domain-containing protein [Jimgerdemannia flammicorona]|uniref:COG4 transport protein-domain-containing protein n=1 Tax=Jimgerdemannia flammicorona TaxID=994334 RepID=A0A433D9A0_9FUNG|nr:COG4 transport protein-domain-containing protein [Jimgerdemannia flammicorona]